MKSYDPTKTTTLRKSLRTVLTKRFRLLRSKLLFLILTEDALELDRVDPVVNVRGWKNLPPDERSRQLKAWIAREVDEGGMLDDVSARVRQGYLKGIDKGFSRTRKLSLRPKNVSDALRREFLVSQFSGNTDTLFNLQSLALSDLQGITQHMETQIIRELTEGLIKGNPKAMIARSIADRINKIGITRAKRLANDAVVRAHAEGALDAMERLGLEEVSVEVEWATAGDNRVCPMCSALENVVMPISKARGLFPRHPNCRCSPIPTSESVNRRRLKNAIKRSVKASPKNDTWKQKV